MHASSHAKLIVIIMILAVAQAPGKAPNILFAIADDWSRHAGAYGTPWVETPGFDRIAREGVLFNNAFTPMAKCAPSRAIVLTGRHLWQLEEAGNHQAVFPPKFKSWPEALMDHGWHVGLTGKGWGPGIALDETGKPRDIAGKTYNRQNTKPPAREISNLDYAANFAEFLDKAPEGAPWSFWYGSLEPHRRYQFRVGIEVGDKQLSDIDHVPAFWPDNETVRTDMLDYAFEVEHSDAHLVRMIEDLERRGMLENTIIVVTSDHGMPFPRVKGYAYPGGNRVPLAIRWPSGIRKPGRVVDDFVDFTDVAATLLDLVAIPEPESGMKPITGKSWRPLLESEREGQILAWRDHVLIGKERTDIGRPHDQGYPIRGIVTAHHLLLRNYEPERWPAGNPETGYLDTDASPTKTAIINAGRKNRADPHWQLNFGMRPAVELYDLTADPDCIDNLAASEAHSEIREKLEARMTTKLEKQGDPRMAGNGQVFDEYPIHNDRTRNFYARFMAGELDASAAAWASPDDFEPEPLPKTPWKPSPD